MRLCDVICCYMRLAVLWPAWWPVVTCQSVSQSVLFEQLLLSKVSVSSLRVCCWKVWHWFPTFSVQFTPVPFWPIGSLGMGGGAWFFIQQRSLSSLFCRPMWPILFPTGRYCQIVFCVCVIMYQRVDVPALAKPAQNGLPQKRLEDDCWIIPRGHLMTHSAREQN